MIYFTSDLFHHSCYFRTWNKWKFSWDDIFSFSSCSICKVNTNCFYFYEHFIFFDFWYIFIDKLQNFRSTIFIELYCFHPIYFSSVIYLFANFTELPPFILRFQMLLQLLPVRFLERCRLLFSYIKVHNCYFSLCNQLTTFFFNDVTANVETAVSHS